MAEEARQLSDAERSHDSALTSSGPSSQAREGHSSFSPDHEKGNSRGAKAGLATFASRRRGLIIIFAGCIVVIMVILALVLPLALILPHRQSGSAKATPTAAVRDGTLISGRLLDGYEVFGGIRYAAAPVGDLRFAPPQPPPSPIQVASVSIPKSKSKSKSNSHKTKASAHSSADQISKGGNTVADAGDAISAGADRRDAPPEPNLRTVQATNTGLVCPQDGDISRQDEDCLFAQIIRSPGVLQNASLPVLLFFHGGGGQAGSGASYIGSMIKMLDAGRKAGGPDVMIVLVNYRLGSLAFLGGTEFDELRQSRSGNVGLNLAFQDMRQAARWTRDNIDQFGGDPDQITIWGQSEGAFGVGSLLTAYPSSVEEPRPFAAAILQSGGPGGQPMLPQSYKDDQFNRVLSDTECGSLDLANATLAEPPRAFDPVAATAHLECLRALPWQKLRMVTNVEADRALKPEGYILGSYAWTPAIDGGPEEGGLFSDRASDLLSSRLYARVPMLSGDDEDEGTVFAPDTFNESPSFEDWLGRIYFAGPDRANASGIASFNDTMDALRSVIAAYPDDPSLGSPFSAADPTDRFYGPTNQYKRAAAVYGDIRWHSNRRLFLQRAAAANVPIHAYLFSNRNPRAPVELGVPHGADLDMILQTVSSPLGATMARQWLTFAATHNPNAQGLPVWPAYGSSSSILLFDHNATSVSADDYRSEAINVLNSDNVLTVTGR
ncbi:alpha/beta-hydrolase [Ceraceosorus guamensis]|uniref:Alpha/beta-hydrolase n=1 Tax=Ceraceosorus guamensis TaxID=1522189 RepID=A0A316W688_9BASI|nr:alpha/beta-hydrolase [Ceraceosorus guamensis]PWN45436.1 alpha/beta-hydrolase [Ceraceosorus guamensis]